MAKKFPGSIPLLVLGAFVALLPKVSLGAVIQVCHGGCPHSTIQGAVNAAASGDTILVSGEFYSEHVTIAGKSLTIEGTPNTIVQGVEDGGPVFTLGAGSGPYYEVDLSYLTVTGGDHTGGSLIGGGIQVRVGAYLHLTAVVVENSQAELGGGIGVMTAGGPPTTLAQCSVLDSRAQAGGGVYVASGASVDVEQCSISNNGAFDGGGIFTETDSTLTIDSSSISGNLASGSPGHLGGSSGSGGGLLVQGNLAMSNSAVNGNSALGGNAGAAEGGGLAIALGGETSIQRTVISQNTIDEGTGAGVFVYSSSSNPTANLTLDTDYIALNTFGYGAGFGLPQAGGVANEGTLILKGTTIANNTSPNCSGGTGCPP